MERRGDRLVAAPEGPGNTGLILSVAGTGGFWEVLITNLENWSNAGWGSEERRSAHSGDAVA